MSLRDLGMNHFKVREFGVSAQHNAPHKGGQENGEPGEMDNVMRPRTGKGLRVYPDMQDGWG